MTLEESFASVLTGLMEQIKARRMAGDPEPVISEFWDTFLWEAMKPKSEIDTNGNQTTNTGRTPVYAAG